MKQIPTQKSSARVQGSQPRPRMQAQDCAVPTRVVPAWKFLLYVIDTEEPDTGNMYTTKSVRLLYVDGSDRLQLNQRAE